MSRIIEQQHDNEPYLLYWFGNATAIDSDHVKSLGIAWLFKEDGRWNLIPRITGNTSLFYNAIFFLRLSLPFGIFASLRWSPSTTARSLFQAGLGWKLNGRLALLFRIQSDATSAQGVTGPNLGQATGFDYGTH